jgi:kynurenine formamidase
MASEETTQPYDGWGDKSPKWWPSRYGDGDELGAQNELSAELTLAALKLPTEGRVIELSQTMDLNKPQTPPRVFHHVTLGHWSIDGSRITPEGSGLTGFEDQITLNSHSTCHLDALGHNGIGGHAYNGVHYREFYTPRGLTKYGIEQVLPWMTRGVVLDIAALEKTEMLPAGFAITPDHLAQACERQGVEVRAGDVVLLHTGWGRLWDEDPRAYFADEPGLGWEAAHWLTDRRVSAIAADNWALEVLPAEDPRRMFVVHQHLLTETGTYILENITTHELVAAGRSEFLFTAAPVKIAGLTGSPISPLAII